MRETRESDKIASHISDRTDFLRRLGRAGADLI